MMPLIPLLYPLSSTYEVASPNGRLVAQFALERGHPTFSLRQGRRPILLPGRLGLDLASGGPLDTNLHLVDQSVERLDQTYPTPFGKAAEVRSRCVEKRFTLEESEGMHRRIAIVVRASDEGVAFRYEVPQQPALTDFFVREELTEFRPVGTPRTTALVLPHMDTPYEETYRSGSLASLEGTLVGLPLMLQYGEDFAVALTEADLTDYPGFYVKPRAGILRGSLSPRLDGSGLAVKARLPHATPWRVVLVGDPKRFLESSFVESLNPPSRISDTSWIRPGKTLFPWWNGYDTGNTGVRPAQTTEYHKWCIDFAAKHGISYHSIDGLDNVAWYGGPIVPYGGAAITRGLPGLDLPEIVRYARTKGVRIRLWMSSAAARAQMATAYPEYERMGIEGVMVDFFDHDDQDTVNLVHAVTDLAARCHLTVTLHNVYKPTGLSRTYPNLLTVEAARNLEFDKWDPVGITPRHEIDVAFVRGLAGPIDFHAGSFRNVRQSDYRPRERAPMTIGTRARQLARYVVYEGALPMIADSPAAYEAEPAGFSFLVEVPTTWDETRVLAGKVGRFIVVARRKGKVWYLGAMTDGAPRTVQVSLGFLGKGPFNQESWADGKGPSDLGIDRSVAGRSVSLRMGPAGGAALRFTPVP